MPTVKQIDPEHAPELFKLYNEETEAYDLDNLEISSSFTEGISIRKRVAGGIADKHVYKDASTLFFQADNEETWVKVARYCAYPETYNSTSGAWDIHPFPHATLDTDGEKIIASCVDNIESPTIQFDVDIQWSFGKIKEQFVTQMLGQLIRTKAFIEVFNSELLTINFDDYPDTHRLDVDRGTALAYYSDYLTDSDNLESLVILTFSPSGVEDIQDVDPYITVDEQSTYIDVTCDGWSWNIKNTVTSTRFGYLANQAGGVEFFHTYLFRVYVSSTTYALVYDSNYTCAVLNSSPDRIVLKCSGNLCDSSHSVLTNSVSVDVYIYIYSDKIFFDFKWVTETGDIVIADSDSGNILIRYDDTGITASNINESNGNEVVNNYTNHVSSVKYCGALSSDINVQLISVYDYESAPYFLYSGPSGDPSAHWNDITIPPGTHRAMLCAILDSAEREGGKQYDSTDRLNLGNQYADISASTDPTLNNGSASTPVI